MWLIDTQTLKLKFFLTPPPQYSILSHVWTDEECSFQEFRFPEHTQALIEKKGFKKIKACCELSLEQGFQWTWVDTCCIDKSSSAELSESINSMFSWYWSSTVCYAYLEDVDSTLTTRKVVQGSTDPGRRVLQGSTDPKRRSEWDSESNDSGSEPVFHYPSRWYSRGWTLQELIAPLKVEFYNCYWTKIGTKWGLRREISSITGISEADLVYYNPRRSSIAQKMSWASARDTTRVEDKAYSLLGLFGVHLPLLYGEGRNAFRRLQEELIRTSTDHTIFAWRDRDRDTLLAGSPAGFHTCGSTVGRVWTLGSKSERRDTKKTYSITNGGLEMELRVLCNVDNTVKHHLQNLGLSRRDLSKFIIGFFDYKDTVLPGYFMGLALMAEGAGRFRVYGQPIALKADVSEQLEIRTVVLAVDRPGGAMPLRRQIPVADTDIDTLCRYRAQIFAAKELAWNSVRRVSSPDSFATRPTAASFMKPTRDHTGLEDIADAAVTPDGVYLFGITERNPFDLLVLNLSAGPTCSITLQLLLSPALQKLDTTDPTERFPTWMMDGLTCHVWETGTAAFGGNSALEGEYDGHTSYWRELSRRLGQDGVWIEHKLLDGRTLEVTVVGTGTGYDSPEIMYIGLKDA